MFSKTNKIIKRIEEEFESFKIEKYYLDERIKWLEKKAGIACPHDDLDYLEDTNEIKCLKCKKIWSRYSALSD